ncbi:MAG TPA: hypothetical protein LFW13_02860 [Rickettsia endosymbiont of Sericostoma sp.]|uniref:hypothetical protein n=1 Tax=Candidatus Tisiphia endosymbiont of Nemotelus uliginosus TaxID=3077926 RepID=UPI001D9682CD|nr:hypothetical protein [Rickettsia endosymbiont of Sericostoma sp.]
MKASAAPEAISTKLIRHSEYTALLVGKTWAKPFASVTLAGVTATLLINPGCSLNNLKILDNIFYNTNTITFLII